MTENQKNIEGMDTKPPEKMKRSGTVLFALILGCWLLLLYFTGGLKGPG